MEKGARISIARLAHCFIIPNANLISNLVTNWTLSDRQARVKIAIGVAYGSDVALVKETLIECAQDNKRVQESPSPKVLFLEFGASSLDFELRAFVPASFRIEATSELHEEIENRWTTPLLLMGLKSSALRNNQRKHKHGENK